ncbi:MAG: glycoside hydrolase family 76 protein [Chitinophagaceae bacterium]
MLPYSLSIYAQNTDYKSAANELYNNIQQNFYIKDSGYYREEALGMHSENPVSFLWPLCAMVQAGNEMDVAFASNHYMDNVLDVIAKYHDDRPPVPGYASYKLGSKTDDRYYDDNQWIGIASLDAYKRTKAKKYLELGTEIYHFSMSGYDTVSGGGIYWVEPKKDGKNTCSNGPGILVALGMYDATGNKQYLDTAAMLYRWIVQHLRAPNGLYYDNYKVQQHRVDSTFFSYNAGTMLESSIWLYTVTKQKSYLDDALLTARSASDYFLSKGFFKDDYWFNAVMLRGYIRLYHYDKNPAYIDMFKKCLNYTLANQKHDNRLFGRTKVENLVGQGGLLEMLCRMAVL